MRRDYNVHTVQPGNRVEWVDGRKKQKGTVIKRGAYDGDGYQIHVLVDSGFSTIIHSREMRRTRQPKRIRNADWCRKNGVCK